MPHPEVTDEAQPSPAQPLPAQPATPAVSPGSAEAPALSDSWGASVVLFAAGSLLWPLVFFLAFFARAALLAAENSMKPHYNGAWRETIEVVAISGSYVGWVAPSLLALLVGLGFLVTPTADIDSLSVLRPLPFVAALIGGFMLAWTVLAVVVLSSHGPTAASEGGQQLWGLLFMTPVSIVLSLVLGRLDFRPIAKRTELMRAAIARYEREYANLADPRVFYSDPGVLDHAKRSPWKRPLFIQGSVSIVVFVAFWRFHAEPLSTALLASSYVAAVGAVIYLLVSLVQRELIDARLSKLAGHELRSRLDTVGGVVLAIGVGALIAYNLWYVFSGLRPLLAPICYALVFLGAAWIANPLRLRRSAWPMQVLRERERALTRMRGKLVQLEAAQAASSAVPSPAA